MVLRLLLCEAHIRDLIYIQCVATDQSCELCCATEICVMWFDLYKTHTLDVVKMLTKYVACAQRAYGTQNTLVIFPKANVFVEMLHQNSPTGFSAYVFLALAPLLMALKQKGRYAVNVSGRFVW